MEHGPSPSAGLGPWRLGDVLRLYAGSAIGAIVLLLAWWGTSGSIVLSTQVTWLAAGVGGLLVAGAFNTAWLVSGRRTLGQRQQQLLERWATSDAGPVAGAMRSHDGAAPSVVVSSPTMTRYHRADCPLVAGKDVAPIDSTADEDLERRPCGVCRP